MYEPYVTAQYYLTKYQGSTIPKNELGRYLKTASRHIDSLTYNRIVDQGFSNLTDFQKEIVQEVVCRQAEFEYENAEEIVSVIASYSINGVSVQFGNSWNMFSDKGIAMRRDDYSFLCQSGLCCRLVG